MLKKKERLTTAMFNKYFAVGRRIHGAHLTLVFTPSPEFHGAVVVGKKLLKSAVARNQLRRRLYNALYSIHRSEPLMGIYILMAKPSAKEVSFQVLRDEIAALVERSAKYR